MAQSLNQRIMRITSLFGGLQIVNIGCSIVRAKAIAIWIGAAGVGLFGILLSTLETIFTLSQLGLRQSAVQSISSGRQQEEGIRQIIHVVRRSALWLGATGSLLTLICSRWLSQIAFGNASYTWAFAWLSITVLLSSLNSAEGAVFQGLRRFKKLAVCSMLGSIGGLAISLPLFRFWGIQSIVPSIIAYIAMTWLAMGLYREKIPKTKVDSSQALAIARKFLSLGFYLTITAVITNATTSIFSIYLNRVAGLDITGYYDAGYTLVNRYAGLVFTAIAMEYFPRLTSVSHSRRSTSIFVTNQLRLAVTIIFPIATIFICIAPWIIQLLYDASFMAALPFVILAMAGTIFRAVSWCMAFTILAKGDGRTFIFTEVSSCAIALLLNIIGFRYGGFIGLGIAYSVWYLIYTLIIAGIYFGKYHLNVPTSTLFYILLCASLTIATSVCALCISPCWGIPGAIIATGISSLMLKKHLVRKK